jgi:hypothetical protein
MVGWLVCKGMPVTIFLKGGNVELTVGFQTRREVMRQMVPRYQKASISQKGVLLNEIALPHKNLPVSVSESSSFPFLSHALSLALKRVHNPLAFRKAR